MSFVVESIWIGQRVGEGENEYMKGHNESYLCTVPIISGLTVIE